MIVPFCEVGNVCVDENIANNLPKSTLLDEMASGSAVFEENPSPFLVVIYACLRFVAMARELLFFLTPMPGRQPL